MCQDDAGLPLYEATECKGVTLCSCDIQARVKAGFSDDSGDKEAA